MKDELVHPSKLSMYSADVLQNSCSQTFGKFHRQTPVLELKETPTHAFCL